MPGNLPRLREKGALPKAPRPLRQIIRLKKIGRAEKKPSKKSRLVSKRNVTNFICSEETHRTLRGEWGRTEKPMRLFLTGLLTLFEEWRKGGKVHNRYSRSEKGKKREGGARPDRAHAKGHFADKGQTESKKKGWTRFDSVKKGNYNGGRKRSLFFYW